MLAVSSPSDSFLLMCTETNISRSSSREIGCLSLSLPGLGMGVMEKRLLDCGSVRWIMM